ncbi:hypothetical protein [Streptomyces sp. NPDC089919]|uniref:hypothetical protein n=1 Tax=Streptomyces sp. NPDC089919 TaxID=3155188 RepID=UPI003431EE03
MTSVQALEHTELAGFAQEWFDKLSRHDPVEEMLPFVADAGLDMAFPERTLRSHADFRDWYAVVGEAFADQSHDIERLEFRPAADDVEAVDVAVTVVWRAKNTADGSLTAVRVDQQWRLAMRPGAVLPVITTYRVGDFTPVA